MRIIFVFLFFSAVHLISGQSCDTVSFTRNEFSFSNGLSANDLPSPTCIAIGHDQHLYLGTLGGTVQVVSYDRVTLQVTAICGSEPVIRARFLSDGEPSVRDILGIAIDPRDSVIRPYISTSTRFHTAQMNIDNRPDDAWRNGEVWRMRPGTSSSNPNICLVQDSRIVTNLPVSNENHSVNDLLFTQDGDLLIAVGGSTNQGLPGFRLGNFWESPLSAAVLIARLSRGGFDGVIGYESASQPFTARQTSGDIDVYASGLRNPFALAMDWAGRVYAADQSSNCNFGNAAVSCNDFNLADAQAFDSAEEEDWPGQVSFEGCDSTGVTRQDKLLFITEGRFYGHANIQRGGDECAWIDPLTNLAADGSAPPQNYQPQVVAIRSPMTGLDLYRATHFCNALRGAALVSRFESRGLFSVGVNDGRLTRAPEQIFSGGGIAFAENAHGELLFVSLGETPLSIFRPDVTPGDRIQITGVAPFRHGLRGGNPVTIGGVNFGTSPTVTIGGQNCRVISSSDTEIQCTVPAHSAGAKDVIVMAANGESSPLSNGLLYMNV